MEKQFSFGFGQSTVEFKNNTIFYKMPGRKKSYISLDNVDTVMYESEVLYGYLTFIGNGTKLDKMRVPKRDKSMEITIEIDNYIKSIKK